MSDRYRYSIARDGRLLDSEPMKDGGNILVFDKNGWVTWIGGTVGEWHDSIPVTPEEAAQFCKDGTIPAEVRRIIDNRSYAPDHEEDAD